MKISFKVDDRETLEQLEGLSMREYMEVWAEAVSRAIREKALDKLGGGEFARRIANSIRQKVSGDRAEVAPGGPEGYIGEAVEVGGEFRSRTRPYLAVPLHERFKKGGAEYGIFPRNVKLSMIALTSRKGNLLLFERKLKGKEKQTEGPLFLLRKSFMHRPRPWWIREAEADKVTKEFIEDNF